MIVSTLKTALTRTFGRRKHPKAVYQGQLLVELTTYAIVSPGAQEVSDEVGRAIDAGRFVALSGETTRPEVERALAPPPRLTGQALGRALVRAGYLPDDV